MTEKVCKNCRFWEQNIAFKHAGTCCAIFIQNLQPAPGVDWSSYSVSFETTDTTSCGGWQPTPDTQEEVAG